MKNKFEAETWLEFCNRFAGVSIILATFGVTSILILESTIIRNFGSINVVYSLGSFTGAILLLLIIGFLNLVGIIVDGGISLPFNPKSSRADLAYNFGRLGVGIGLIVGTYKFMNATNYPPDQTLIEEIIETIALLGVLCLVLAPILYGLALIFRGGFAIIDEYRWRE